MAKKPPIDAVLEIAVREGKIKRKEKADYVALAASLRHYSIADVRRVINDMLRDGELDDAKARAMTLLMEAFSEYLDNDGNQRLS